MTQRKMAMLNYGRGPWRILPECPSPDTHNSARAALGQGSGRARLVDRPKCICPRGLDLLREELDKRTERKRQALKAVSRTKSEAKPESTAAALVEVRTPDFSAGLCTSRAGMKVADGGQNDQASHKGIALRQKAKDLCGVCPLRAMCLDWVTGHESPPGSWGGVWGGLDPWNRRGQEMTIQDGRAKVVPYVHA